MVGFVCFMRATTVRGKTLDDRKQEQKREPLSASSGEARLTRGPTITKARENGKSDSTRFVFHGSRGIASIGRAN